MTLKKHKYISTNMCDHDETIPDEGWLTCTHCGLVISRVVDVSSITYDKNKEFGKKIVYTRASRFRRLMCNLRGWQNVEYATMKKIAGIAKYDSIQKLRSTLIEHRMKKILNKIPSIWRQLGNNFVPPSEQDFTKADEIFAKIKDKKSFILLMPYILQKIGRSDLCALCKKPTKLLQKKYTLYINEKDWDTQ